MALTLGSTAINKLYLGSTAINKAYLGTGVVFSSAFDPASLFAGGTEGAWFDPSDIDTLFQDSAGTTPVTTAGQPVGLMLDNSGNGNHATQATAAARPTYQTGPARATLDKVDDPCPLQCMLAALLAQWFSARIKGRLPMVSTFQRALMTLAAGSGSIFPAPRSWGS